MNCRKVSRWFSAYIDGDLLPNRKALLDEHLQSCSQCREKLTDLKLIVQTAADLEVKRPGPYFANRVLCAISAKSQPGEILSSWKFRLTLSSMAFVVAACVTIFVVGPQTNDLPISPISGNMANSAAVLSGEEQPNVSNQNAGFPVPAEALKRDMALTDSLNADTNYRDSIVLPPNYMQQVDLKKSK